MKKIIFIDFDGTLLNDTKEISQTNIEAITMAHKRGYQIVPLLWSSRRSHTYKIQQPLENDNPLHYRQQRKHYL